MTLGSGCCPSIRASVLVVVFITKASHPGAGAAEGELQRQLAAERYPEGGAGTDRAGLRQPARGVEPHQAAPADAASFQGGERQRLG